MERYAAFISYAHRDEADARWLHRAIEHYRFPKGLIGSESAFGPVPKRLPPVFRDRDELHASADLGSELNAALGASRFQIVLCSPRAAKSKWVNEEILSYKRMFGERRTLALIVSGEPYAGGEEECFPEALRFRLAPDGTLSDEPAEPIAADIRPGKDGRRLALLKLLAGLSGVKLDQLARRDAARRQRRLLAITASSVAISLLTIGLAIYAETQRREAVEQRELADRSLDFLTGTFEIANPATENPRTITALTILDRASKRAASEFAGEPKISARLLRTTGTIYDNLGLLEESERDLRAALAREPQRGEARADILLSLAGLAKRHGDADAVEKLADEADKAYNHDAAYAPPLDARLAEQRANVAYLKADYARAARLYDKQVALTQALPGDHRTPLIQALTNEALSLVKTRSLDEADTRFVRATQLAEQTYGANDVRTARTLQNRAFVLFESGKLAQAAELMQRAAAIYDRVLEGDHPTIAAAQLLLGRLYTASGKPVEGLAAFDKARGIFVRLYGADNPAVGDTDFYAAEAEAARGRLPRALDRLATTKAIYDSNYGPEDPDQVELLIQRAKVLAMAKRNAEAQAQCVQANTLQARMGATREELADTARRCKQAAGT